MKRYLSNKNRLIVASLWSIAVVLFLLLVLNIMHQDLTLLPIIILSMVIALIVWVLLDTRYVIKKTFLLYRSGPFRGRIDIKKINKVRWFSGLYVPVTMKPALGTNGFIITYNNIEDLYVSPKKAEKFIEDLLKVNPTIEVV